MHAGLGFHKSIRIMGNKYFWGRTLRVGCIYNDSYLKLPKIKAKTLIYSTQFHLLSLFLNVGLLVYSIDALVIFN